MMAALLLLFVLVLCYSVYQYFLMLETKTSELDQQSALLSSQQATLATQQTTLDEQQLLLNQQKSELEAQQLALQAKETELEETRVQLNQQQALLATEQQNKNHQYNVGEHTLRTIEFVGCADRQQRYIKALLPEFPVEAVVREASWSKRNCRYCGMPLCIMMRQNRSF